MSTRVECSGVRAQLAKKESHIGDVTEYCDSAAQAVSSFAGDASLSGAGYESARSHFGDLRLLLDGLRHLARLNSAADGKVVNSLDAHLPGRAYVDLSELENSRAQAASQAALWQQSCASCVANEYAFTEAQRWSAAAERAQRVLDDLRAKVDAYVAGASCAGSIDATVAGRLAKAVAAGVAAMTAASDNFDSLGSWKTADTAWKDQMRKASDLLAYGAKAFNPDGSVNPDLARAIALKPDSMWSAEERGLIVQAVDEACMRGCFDSRAATVDTAQLNYMLLLVGFLPAGSDMCKKLMERLGKDYRAAKGAKDEGKRTAALAAFARARVPTPGKRTGSQQLVEYDVRGDNPHPSDTLKQIIKTGTSFVQADWDEFDSCATGTIDKTPYHEGKLVNEVEGNVHTAFWGGGRELGAAGALVEKFERAGKFAGGAAGIALSVKEFEQVRDSSYKKRYYLSSEERSAHQATDTQENFAGSLVGSVAGKMASVAAGPVGSAIVGHVASAAVSSPSAHAWLYEETSKEING